MVEIVRMGVAGGKGEDRTAFSQLIELLIRGDGSAPAYYPVSGAEVIGRERVPPSTLGAVSSLRGWPVREVHCTDSSSFAIGSRSMAVSLMERDRREASRLQIRSHIRSTKVRLRLVRLRRPHFRRVSMPSNCVALVRGVKSVRCLAHVIFVRSM